MGFRTALLVWPDEGLRLCREGDANMGWRQAGFGAPCCVARRRSKALRAGRRQHGRRRREKRRSLLAWPDEGLRLCREGDANMGAGSAENGGSCWRGSTEEKGFAGRATPTWAPAARERAGLVGVALRRIKALPGGRRQHGLAPGGIRGALLVWPDERLRLCGQGDANMGSGNQSSQKGRFLRPIRKKRAKPPHMNCDCSALYLLNCPAGPTYRICLPSLLHRS